MGFYELTNDDRFKDVEYGEGTDWESIVCPINAGHQRVGKGIGNLKVNIVSKRDSDFLWTFFK